MKDITIPMLTPQTLQANLEERFGGLLAKDPGSPIGWREWTEDDTVALYQWLEKQNGSQAKEDVSCLNQKEAAREIGVSIPTLMVWLRRGDNPVPHFKEGKKILIPTFTLREWMREEIQRNLAAQQINAAGLTPEGHLAS